MKPIAVLLHDAVEDQGGKNTLEAIHTLFGSTVATIVKGCTDAFDVLSLLPQRVGVAVSSFPYSFILQSEDLVKTLLSSLGILQEMKVKVGQEL